MDINPKTGIASQPGAPIADDLYPAIGPADPAERTGEKSPIESAAVRTFRIDYHLHHEARHFDVQLAQTQLSTQDAALHLLALHFGDGENSLLMPAGDAGAEQVLAQAAVMGLTDISAREL